MKEFLPPSTTCSLQLLADEVKSNTRWLVFQHIEEASQYPLGFGQWLQALSYALSSPREIALVGDPTAADTRALLAVLRDGYRPHQVVALGAPTEETPTVPLLRQRTPVDGRATAYVCVRMVCQLPITSSKELRSALERA